MVSGSIPQRVVFQVGSKHLFFLRVYCGCSSLLVWCVDRAFIDLSLFFLSFFISFLFFFFFFVGRRQRLFFFFRRGNLSRAKLINSIKGTQIYVISLSLFFSFSLSPSPRSLARLLARIDIPFPAVHAEVL